MKKFFSLIALVGVFAACQQEDLKTAFTVNPAEATINVEVSCIDPSIVMEGVTYSYNGVSAGSSYTLTAPNGTTPLNQTVEVVCTWGGVDGFHGDTKSQSVAVAVLPGSKASYNVKLVLGKRTDPEGYEYEAISVQDESMTTYDTFFVDVNHESGLSEKGILYSVNNTEFVLFGKISCKEFWGTEVYAGVNWKKGVEPLAFFEELAEAFDEGRQERDGKFEFTVSAMCQFTVFQVLTTEDWTMHLLRTDANGKTEEIADFSYWSYASSDVTYAEEAIPGHEAHYVPGHGVDDPIISHGHSKDKGAENAGGGIVYAD